MAALSSKERHRSIEEAVYKVFEIPEALQEFSQVSKGSIAVNRSDGRNASRIKTRGLHSELL